MSSHITRKNPTKINPELYNDILSYIEKTFEAPLLSFYKLEDITCCKNTCAPLVLEEKLEQCSCPSELIELMDNIDDGFAVTLLKLIDAKGLTDVECYKKANVSKQTWYKIMNEQDYKPSKNTVLCFAIALELSLEETDHLLSTVGFTLSKSSKFDIIIEYFLLHGVYDIFTINETLFEFDQVCLI